MEFTTLVPDIGAVGDAGYMKGMLGHYIEVADIYLYIYARTETRCV